MDIEVGHPQSPKKKNKNKKRQRVNQINKKKTKKREKRRKKPVIRGFEFFLPLYHRLQYSGHHDLLQKLNYLTPQLKDKK